MLRLATQDLDVTVNPRGGRLGSAFFQGTPFLRPRPMGSFPLVPFGNRVSGNRFSFRGETHIFHPNTADDPLYLHGDGWLSTWSITRQTKTDVTLAYQHETSSASPYAYLATQTITVENGELTLALAVENKGGATLPFGLGQHPYFVRTPLTTLIAPAKMFWTERGGHLSGMAVAIPDDLDFTRPRALPDRWVNNAFDGWDGSARIVWPELGLAANIFAEKLFRSYMMYAREERQDFFCFEPMSHLPDGLNMASQGGMTVLEPGGKLSGRITIELVRLED